MQISKKYFKYIFFIVFLLSILFSIYYILNISNIIVPSGYKEVLVMEINGEIDSSNLNINQIVQTLRNFNYDGLVLYIDSPGGTTSAIRIVYALQNLSVPVICYVQGEATSAAYWICSQSDYIIANPDSIVGNIGAYIQIIDLQGLLNKLGIDVYYIQSTPYKTIGNPYENLTPEEYNYLQSILDNLTYEFESDVLAKRNITNESLAFSGLFFLPQEAEQLGLINQIGDFEDVKYIMAKMLNTTPNHIIFIYRSYQQNNLNLLSILGSYLNSNVQNNLYPYIVYLYLQNMISDSIFMNGDEIKIYL